MNNYCPEIYKGLFVDRWNDNQLRIAPCCQATPAVENISNFSFANSKYLNQLRKEFDDGIKSEACSRCWHSEKVGKKSRRQDMIEFFGTSDNNIELISLDHSATWACNSACIMCYEGLSSLWATELGVSKTQLKSLGRFHQKDNKFSDQLNFSNLKKLHFNGGEPLINNEHKATLNELNNIGQLGKVFISYNTNGTLYPDSETIDLWSKAHLVRLFFSIDAIGDAFEYIRYPGKWNQTVENLNKFKKEMPDNVLFGLNVTVGSYNILEMPDLLNWFNKNISTNRSGDPSDFNWQFAYNFDPRDLCKPSIEHAIMLLKPIDKLKSIIEHLKIYKTNDRWINKLDNIDARRNTNWKKSLKIGKFYD